MNSLDNNLKVMCPYCGADQIENIGDWPGARWHAVCWRCYKGYYNWINKEYERKYGKNVRS